MLHHFKVGPKHLQFQIYILFRASKRFRVAEVGRLSAKAKNAINSSVERVFANSRQKKRRFIALNQKLLYTGIYAF